MWKNLRYTLREQIGSGDGGIVYVAQDRLTKKHVAIKKQHTPAFPHEALFAHLKHHSIPTMYEFFIEAPYWYLVMDYIEGITLQRYQFLKYDSGALPFEKVLYFGIQLCNSLAYLHAQGILHRDIKPRNILISPEEHLYLIDFERACTLSGSQNDFIGPGVYAAPECGKAGYDLSSAIDVYGAGKVLQELFTGSPAVPEQYQYAPETPEGQLERILARMTMQSAMHRPRAVVVASSLARISESYFYSCFVGRGTN